MFMSFINRAVVHPKVEFALGFIMWKLVRYGGQINKYQAVIDWFDASKMRLEGSPRWRHNGPTVDSARRAVKPDGRRKRHVQNREVFLQFVLDKRGEVWYKYGRLPKTAGTRKGVRRISVRRLPRRCQLI